ncbi:DUF6894 family protein [Methylobacterium platani]|uniref:DUF6894 domain-containing protein n=2 Tax=Methylobacterium platani TaxID=427683 RepID=A0A179SF06_9HYPH|nr:hypothetical protein [Methylobacterium platani]KMO14606.1 hypothetical protein SQ03_19345 [Methylobacterium platani JCM 14648]OAS26457.1 hypothetical protein A5481_05225 [Methylobacterium platani]
MSLYFFNLRHGPGADGLAVDTEGDELAGPAEARARALAAAHDLIARTRLHSVRDWFTCAFEVTDAAGRPVMTVPFSDTVTEDDEGSGLA